MNTYSSCFVLPNFILEHKGVHTEPGSKKMPAHFQSSVTMSGADGCGHSLALCSPRSAGKQSLK